MDAVDLAAYADGIGRPDADIRNQAQQRWHELAVPTSGLGRIEDLSVWLAGVQRACPTRPIERPRVVVFAADHGVAAAEVSALRPESTARAARLLIEGGGTTSVLARLYGATVRLVDVGIASPLTGVAPDVGAYRVGGASGRIDREDALSAEEAEQAFQAGVAVADAEIDAGADLLVPGALGVGGTTVAATLVAGMTGADPASVTGRGSGIDDPTWMRKCSAIRDALRRARPVVNEPLRLLAVAGGADVAALTGFVLQAALRATPVIIGGAVPAAAALLAQRVAFRTPDWLIAGNVSPEPAHRKALERMSLDPLRDDAVRVDEGAGGLLALPTVRAAAALFAELPTFAAAGVPEPLLRSRL